jgi:hypothetical protein
MEVYHACIKCLIIKFKFKLLFKKFWPFLASFPHLFFINYLTQIQYYLVIVYPLVTLPYPHH